MKPLFMWAGGKNKMLEKYQPFLPNKFSKYCEPFFGGGAMFIWAYKQKPEAQFIINDINEYIVGIYNAIKTDLSDFLDKMDDLEKTYISLSEPSKDKHKIKENKDFEKQFKIEQKGRYDWSQIYKERPSRRSFYFSLREEYAFDYQKWNKTEEAAVLYFLMKTGFNGVWQLNANTNNRFGTPCGLLNQKGSVYDKQNVKLWNKALQNVLIKCGDFKDTVSHVEEDTYVFLDPPYRGSFADYGTQSDDQFQEEVIDFLNVCKNKGAYCLLSNRHIDDNFFIDRLKDNQLEYFDVTYTAGRRKKITEGNEIKFEAKKAIEILMVGDGRK